MEWWKFQQANQARFVTESASEKIEIGKYLAYLRAIRWIVSCALFDF